MGGSFPRSMCVADARTQQGVAQSSCKARSRRRRVVRTGRKPFGDCTTSLVALGTISETTAGVAGGHLEGCTSLTHAELRP